MDHADTEVCPGTEWRHNAGWRSGFHRFANDTGSKEAAMGDKGGKKDKDKDQKQKMSKQQQEAQKKQQKQQKSTP